MNARQASWLAFLRKYDIEIKIIKGKETKVVDSLSRNKNMNFTTIVSICVTNLENIINNASKNDEEYLKMKRKLEENRNESEPTSLSIEWKDLLMYTNWLYVPNWEEVKCFFLNELHKNPYTKHSGY